MAAQPPTEIRDNAEASRYEIAVGERLAGIAEYQRRPGRIVFVHTEVYPDFKGQGFADLLAIWALGDVRARGEVVIARCPFIAAYIARHAEYQDLLAGRRAGGGPQG